MFAGTGTVDPGDDDDDGTVIAIAGAVAGGVLLISITALVAMFFFLNRGSRFSDKHKKSFDGAPQLTAVKLHNIPHPQSSKHDHIS